MIEQLRYLLIYVKQEQDSVRSEALAQNHKQDNAENSDVKINLLAKMSIYWPI